MIPIRDTIPSRNYPIVNNILIVTNIFFYFVEVGQGANFNNFIYQYGVVPARYSSTYFNSFFPHNIFTLFSFMFLHGGFWHLLGNMWSLYIFGDNIEDNIGHFRYLFFYLLCGMFSGLSHVLLNLNSDIPTIGASGAIAGVMGAYFILYPRSKILTLIPILFIPYFIEIPAFFFLGFWLLMQIINAAGSSGSMAGIAWWAHIGGFIMGIIILRWFVSIPASHFAGKIRKATEKKKSHHLQVIHPKEDEYDHNLYGTIIITTYEGLMGTKKLVNIPRGFNKRILRVTIPQGIKQGALLRLKGLGKHSATDKKGDLLLKVEIHDSFNNNPGDI